MSEADHDEDPGINQIEEHLKLIDEMVVQGVKDGSALIGRSPSCETCSKPGCCYQLLAVTLAECFPLARRIVNDRKDSEEFRRQLFQVGVEMETAGRQTWWEMAKPCPLLTAERKCEYYEYRPIACRYYYAWSEPKLCQPPIVENVQTLAMPLIMHEQLKVNLALCESLGLGPRMYIGSLPRILAIVLNVLDLDTNKAIEFIERQPFPTVEQVPVWFSYGMFSIFQKNQSI